MAEGPKARSWWQTLPGLVTAAAALITAVAGAIVGLYQAGIFKREANQPSEIHNAPPSSISHQGKVSDELSTLQWTFQVRNVWQTDEYAERYYQEQRLIHPQGGNDTLIVIDVRLQNRLQKTQTPVLTERQPGNTGLIDDANHSYQPVDYDARQLSDKIQSFEAAPLLPGAGADFALVFSVPRGTKPELLLFTLKNYDNILGGKDVRVVLKK